MSIVVVSGKLLLCATKTDNGNILSTDAMELSINCFDVRMSERNINFGRLLQLILEVILSSILLAMTIASWKNILSSLQVFIRCETELCRYGDYFDIRPVKSNRRSRSRSGVASWINELQVSSIVQHISVRNIVRNEDSRKNATISRNWIFAKYSQ